MRREVDVSAASGSVNAKSEGSVWGYIILTCLFSWPLWIASGVLSRRGLGAYDFSWLLAQVGVFGPSLAALIVSSFLHKELWRNHLRVLPVLVLPLVLPGILIARETPAGPAEFSTLPAIVAVVVAAVVALFFSPLNRRLASPATGERYRRPQAKWFLLSVGLFPGLFLLAWLVVNLQRGEWSIATFQNGGMRFAWTVLVSFSHSLLLGGPLGEELGWRGFLLPELLKRHRPLTASLILGVIWGLWHLPIDIYAGFGLQGVGAILIRVFTSIAITVFFTWFYLHTHGNLLVALLLHTSINFLPDLGFSRYDLSMVLFVALIGLTAYAVSASSRVFQRGRVE